MGWAAGGPADAVARTIGEELSRQLNQPVMIDNRAGAGGNIGSVAAARAKPDGYDPMEDFAPIGLINFSPSVMLVPADSPYNDVVGFVDYAKKNPGKLTIVSGGVGSSQHLAGASFMQKTGTDLLHVPFKSTAPAFTDLMAGRVDSIITTGALTPVSSGKVKPLAITAKKRLAALPDFYMSSWYGLVAPKGTPDEVLNRLNEALTKSLENPKIQEDFVRLGAVPAEPMTKEEFWTMVGDGMGQAKELVELSGAREQR